MSQSFGPPRVRPSHWIIASAMALIGAAVCGLTLVDGLRVRSWLEIPAQIIADESAVLETQTELTMRYPTGERVTCYVNPTNPEQAILLRDPAVHHWLLPAAFLAVAAGCGYGAKRAFAQQRIADIATLYSLERGELVTADASHLP